MGISENSTALHLEPIVVMFIVARFILGFGSVFCIVAASSLIGGKAKGI